MRGRGAAGTADDLALVSSSSSLLSEVDMKTESPPVPGVLFPPVDLVSLFAKISWYFRPSSLTDSRAGEFGARLAMISRRAKGGSVVLPRCSRTGKSRGGELGAEGKENALRSRGRPAVTLGGLKAASDAGGRNVAVRDAKGGRDAPALVGEALERRRSD